MQRAADANAERLERALFHPSIQAITAFIRALRVEITATTVRERLMALPDFPVLGLGQAQEAFDAWGLPSAAFEVEPSRLRDVPPPLLTAIEEQDQTGGAEVRLLAVITGWHDEGVELEHPVRGSEVVPWDRFHRGCRGPFLAAIADCAAAEPDYAARTEAEERSRRTYVASIRTFPGLLAPEQCDRLIAACEEGGLFRASMVRRPQGDIRHYASDLRTSRTAHLPGFGGGPFDAVYAHAAATLDIAPERFEPMQCVRYDPGQSFHAHFDGLHREATLLVYLNDRFEGGETFFPDAGTSIAPRAGMGVLFRNRDADGRPIPWARHAGLPPRAGTKYVCNLWVRQRG
jgi:hypothetical protein